VPSREGPSRDDPRASELRDAPAPRHPRGRSPPLHALREHARPQAGPEGRYYPAAPQLTTPAPETGAPLATAGGFFSSLTIIGQYNAAYIVCQHGTELVLIDQHAAHERVAFERLKTQFAGGAIEAQWLLFPETLDFSFREAATVRDNIAGLQRLGFSLEGFGGRHWLVKAVPRFLAGRGEPRTLREFRDNLASPRSPFYRVLARGRAPQARSRPKGQIANGPAGLAPWWAPGTGARADRRSTGIQNLTMDTDPITNQNPDSFLLPVTGCGSQRSKTGCTGIQ